MLTFLKRFASNRSQRGLWHGKDIRTGRSYSFSHIGSLRTFKPNIDTKTFWSHILQRFITTEVSMKALRCIRKKGSLDNYILKTPIKDMRSKFGETLREHMLKKLENPQYKVPYIKGMRKAWKSAYQKSLIRPYPMFIPPQYRNKDISQFEFNRYDPDAPERPELDEIENKTQEEVIKEPKLKNKFDAEKITDMLDMEFPEDKKFK